MKVFAQVISWVFMPLFMPMYALLLVMFVPSNQDFLFNYDNLFLQSLPFKTALLTMFGIFCVVAPGISFILLKRSGVISSVEMDTKKERTVPIIVMMIYCLVLYIMFVLKAKELIIPKFIFALPLSGVVVTAIFLIVNRWKKISIHSGAAGILSGFVLAYLLAQTEYQLWVFTLTILISGLVMSARLYLERHTNSELIIGWMIGSFTTFGINYFY